MKSEKKLNLRKEKNQASPSEPYKLGLNFQTHKLLNSQPRLNLKAQQSKI
jgi:hypothetical protein